MNCRDMFDEMECFFTFLLYNCGFSCHQICIFSNWMLCDNSAYVIQVLGVFCTHRCELCNTLTSDTAYLEGCRRICK